MGPSLEIIQTDITQGLQLASNFLYAREVERLPNGHAQHIADRFAIEFVGQHLVLEALPAAGFTRCFDFIQERHVPTDDPA